MLAAEHPQAFKTVAGDQKTVPEFLEVEDDRLTDRFIILDDKDAGRVCFVFIHALILAEAAFHGR